MNCNMLKLATGKKLSLVSSLNIVNLPVDIPNTIKRKIPIRQTALASHQSPGLNHEKSSLVKREKKTRIKK